MNRKQRRATVRPGKGKLDSLGLGSAAVNAARIANMFNAALGHQQSGRLAEAETLYRQILAIDPDHSDSLHFLGMIAYQVGRNEIATDLIGKAIALNDQVPVFHSNLGTVFQSLGKLNEAVVCYQRALALNPDFAEIQNNLGCALKEQNKLDEAVARFKRALALKPDYAEAHYNLGATLARQDQPAEAMVCYDRALALKPDDADIHNDLGSALAQQGKLTEAIACFERALALKPEYAQAHNNIGTALKEQNKLDEAIIHFKRALALKPEDAEAHYNLGVALVDQGKPGDAVACYERALALRPGYGEACNNLGSVLEKLGKIDAAMACYEQALSLRPERPEAYANLANARIATGNVVEALDIATHALRIRETPETRETLFRCLTQFSFTGCAGDFREIVLRALTEPWGRPHELTAVAIQQVKLDKNIRESVKRAADSWPRRLSEQDLCGPSGLTAICEDRLLLGLLESAAVSNVEFERFLTSVRAAALEVAIRQPAPRSVADNVLILCCALARQCFINEYVFAYAGDEMDRAQMLRESLMHALRAGSSISALSVAVSAMYFPLHALPMAEQLLEESWPHTVTDLLTQQVREPKEERHLRPTIPQLTPVHDNISRAVQRQYEENPYPRWMKVAPVGKLFSFDVALRRRFPFASFRNLGRKDSPDVLIAGCGTGRQAIDTAQHLPGSRILAIDLSLPSLCYAKRMTCNLGLENIEYAQADILELGGLGRTFDYIEAGGVLHHLADPMAGWRVLLSLLRADGFMRLGFYSALARKNVVAARAFIAERKYTDTADDIRRCRQELAGFDADTPMGSISKAVDFFSTSECRDYLFHVQEHRLTLPEIRIFLDENKLRLIGFDIEPRIARQYRARFPDDEAMIDLNFWHVFETENPLTFLGMYQFLIQKPG